MKCLDLKEYEIFSFIKGFIETHGYPPTVREIGRGVHLKATSSVVYYLKNMKKCGMIDYVDASPRTITLIGYKIELTRTEN